MADQSHLSGAELWRRNLRRSAVAIVCANAVAAVVVFVFGVFVLPAPHVPNTERNNLINLGVFVVALAVAFPVVTRASTRRTRPIGEWLKADRPPTPEERDMALRAPFVQAQLLAVAWGAAALLFFTLNLFIDVGLAFEVLALVLLGGVVTSALGYLLIERINRENTARALAIGPPPRP